MVHHPSSTFIQTEQVYNHEKIKSGVRHKKLKYKFKKTTFYFFVQMYILNN